MKTMVSRGLLSVALLITTPAFAANGVVSSPCNESSFNSVLATVQGSGGGTITFNCGGAAAITFLLHTGPARHISTDVVIDGANLITLDGNATDSFFQVFSNKNFTLKNITLQNGALDSGGVHALESFGNLTLSHVSVNANSSKGSAVLINNGSLNVQSSTFANNSIKDLSGNDNAGAAIQVVFGDVGISGSTFSNNTIPYTITAGEGGAIAFGGGTLNIAHSAFNSNSAYVGGAIQFASGTTALVETTTFTGNSANVGGALENDGATVTIKKATFSTNNTTGFSYGGAIWNRNGNLTVDSSEFTGNKAGSAGGAINNSDILYVNNSAFSGNTSGTNGGAIYAGGDFYSNDSTFYNNTATGLGGALFQSGFAVFELTFATVVGNSAADGGLSGGMSGTHTPDVGYSIVSANKVGAGPTIDNCAGNFNSIGYNVSDGTSCGGVFTATGDHVNASVPMQSFGNYGGSTSTLPPAASGNIAVNLIPTSPAGCVAFDQRGAVRPAGTKCDSGAFELNGIIDEIFPDGFEAF